MCLCVRVFVCSGQNRASAIFSFPMQFVPAEQQLSYSREEPLFLVCLVNRNSHKCSNLSFPSKFMFSFILSVMQFTTSIIVGGMFRHAILIVTEIERRNSRFSMFSINWKSC